MIKAPYAGFLSTPPLWEKNQFDIQQFEFPSLSLNTFAPKPIPPNIRLGHRMEHVFTQLVEYSGAYDIALHNLPIRQGGSTLGEIDFILNNKTTEKLIHVELTYKFYIIDLTIPEPIHRLIGPNRRDSFFAKMGKIKNKQFPLLHSREGIKALQDREIDHLEVEHQCCFKAQLFLPYGIETFEIGILNKGCLVGYWLRFDDFNKPKFAEAQYYIPTKSEWVIDPNDQVTWKSHSEIKMDINKSLLEKRAPMIWLKKLGTKFEKLFVVWW